MADGRANFAYSTVATAPSPATSGVSLTLATGGGAVLPAVPFNVTVWATASQPLAANAEIMRVTAIVGDVLTVTRAQEGSSARTVVVGDQIAATITAKTLSDIEGKRTITEDSVVKSGYGKMVVSDLEISAGTFLELEADSIMEIS